MGERGRVVLQFNKVDAAGAKTPFDLTGYTITVDVVEIEVDVASTPPTRANPAGSLSVSNPVATGTKKLAAVSVGGSAAMPVTADRQAGDDVGRVIFSLGSPDLANPPFAAARLPAQVVWIEIEKANEITMRPFAVFYRTGRGAPVYG